MYRYRRAQIALEKGEEDLAREALKRRKSYAVSISLIWYHSLINSNIIESFCIAIDEHILDILVSHLSYYMLISLVGVCCYKDIVNWFLHSHCSENFLSLVFLHLVSNVQFPSSVCFGNFFLLQTKHTWISMSYSFHVYCPFIRIFV